MHLSRRTAKRGLTPLPEANRAYVDSPRLSRSQRNNSFGRSRARLRPRQESKAYEALIDQLLSSPQYGEHWGRHWLDIWRYSDWYGYRKTGQVRYSQRHIWRWRDWTVDALNKDKPYAQMILEMLAGDELAPSDPDTARATATRTQLVHVQP